MGNIKTETITAKTHTTGPKPDEKHTMKNSHTSNLHANVHTQKKLTEEPL